MIDEQETTWKIDPNYDSASLYVFPPEDSLASAAAAILLLAGAIRKLAARIAELEAA